ncbi:hypothetical protein DET64_103316 [Marinobacter nauticus]|jgi:hypothetical protein|uniref:Uncharacterized protein n=1 Tax=Marinobacter nauticus TaxID=2743 RepID=A0A368V6U6_MARNT|nr:hypothetical protein DET64_103316 [Marinobacter nauticus]RCW36523.1 hypothetical protein DET51_103316 [Marinobacter nauticus]
MTRMISKHTVYSAAGCLIGQTVRAMVKDS